MNRKGGVAVTAMILAILGVSYRPRQATESNRASDTGKRSTKPLLGASQKKRRASSSTPKLVDSCQQIASRLGRFYADKPPIPDSCLEDPSTPNNTSLRPTGKLRFVLAIVPNPIQTHLPLMFDRAIEVIQQAAQDANYVYDSSWFPWNQTEKSYDLLDDQQAAGELESLLEKQPGILVFRSGLNNWNVNQSYVQCEKEIGAPSIDPHCLKEFENEDKHEKLAKPYETGLVVFVVGEQPTGGISDFQFKNALQWMHALGADQHDQELCILGPTFSGSLPSLALELETETTDQQSNITSNVFKQYAGGIVIHSGTTSAESSVHWFNCSWKSGVRNWERPIPKT